MSVRRIQPFKNPSPGIVVLAFILALIVLTLGDISARAGRADAWVILCGQCDNSGSAALTTHTTTRTTTLSTTGAFRDVPYLSR